MRAIVIATGVNPHIAALTERHPAPMLPLIDRPFIQHVVEYLVDQGVTEFDFILSHLPEQVEHLLGDGRRWGSRFRFHLARDPLRPYALLRTILTGEQKDEGDFPFLLVHADRLPHVRVEHTPPSPTTLPVLFTWRDPSRSDLEDDRPQWTGWAWISSHVIRGLPEESDERALEQHLRRCMADEESHTVDVPHCLGVRSFEDLLAAQRAVLDKAFPDLLLSGREIEPGIWLSRNVSLHPTARLIPPVYVGRNCRIGEGVQLGPYVVVGHDCALDARCLVSESVIFPGSYVGEALELDHVLVDKNRLINVRLGAAVSVADDFILGSLSESTLHSWIAGMLSRLVATGILMFTGPLLLLTALYLKLARSGAVLQKKDVVALPTSPDEAQWRTFPLWSFAPPNHTDQSGRPHDWGWQGPSDLLLRALPALINIARGELRFVGVCPRTPEEIRSLPHDWRELYLRTKAGLITEAFVHYGAHPDEDELYSAEAFYSVMASLRHDLSLMLGFFGRLFKGMSARPIAWEQQES